MHAERLHDPDVWRRVQRAVDGSRMPWTVFVEPLDARIRGIDLRPQLDWLAERGHEVALHVHHRPLHGAAGHTTGYAKRMTREPAVVRRCMDEAADYLAAAGHRPTGFVSGTWLLLESVFQWLAGHGLRYDCTMRTYSQGGPRETGEPDDAIGPPAATRVPGIVQLCGVLEVPTTASLRQQARAELPGLARHPAREDYELFYLHDYDLLDARKRLAVRIIARRRRDDAATVSALIDSMLGSGR
jgi:peptidoglycan/xylan/chitin deacetylase (PgdA/CDA1 family)